MKPACKDCKFSSDESSNRLSVHLSHDCRIRSVASSFFPARKPDDWCGEFVEREPPPVKSVTHDCPVGSNTFTPCCKIPVGELPRMDKLTLIPNLVTCTGGRREKEPEYARVHYRIYRNPDTTDFHTLTEAAQECLSLIADGAWPEKITRGDIVIWERHSGVTLEDVIRNETP